MHTVELYII